MQLQWKPYFKRGKTFLSQHRLCEAVKAFEQALHSCPVEDYMSISSILYFCGVALHKLGHIESAMECWRSSVSVFPESPAVFMIRKTDDEIDRNWLLFKSIQLQRYFSFKGKSAFYSIEERKKVLHIIRTYWNELLASNLMKDVDPGLMKSIFSELQIDFQQIFCSSDSREYTNIIALSVCRTDNGAQYRGKSLP